METRDSPGRDRRLPRPRQETPPAETRDASRGDNRLRRRNQETPTAETGGSQVAEQRRPRLTGSWCHRRSGRSRGGTGQLTVQSTVTRPTAKRITGAGRVSRISLKKERSIIKKKEMRLFF